MSCIVLSAPWISQLSLPTTKCPLDIPRYHSLVGDEVTYLGPEKMGILSYACMMASKEKT